ncbi:uncharacterized protein LOC144624883 [Crassostrea virginica]
MEFMKICSICVLLLLGGNKPCREFHSCSASVIPVHEGSSEDATKENDYTATKNPMEKTTITSSTTENYYTTTVNPLEKTIITLSTTVYDCTAMVNPVERTIITPSTTDNDYTATENPVENTTITPLAKTVYINATTSSSRTVTEETKEDPEFVLFENIATTYEGCYKLCNNISNNATKFHPLFFYNLTEDLNNVVRFISNSYFGYIGVWTDYQELVISNHTGHVINITQEASNKLCVILEVGLWMGNLKKMPCNKIFSVVCRAHNASFYGYNSSPGSDQYCDPVRIRNRTPTVEQLDKMLTDIRKNLTVAKANLSSNIRKRKSASDPRTSSRIIGMTLGVIIICLSASVVIIPDMLAVLNFLVSKCIRQCMTT